MSHAQTLDFLCKRSIIIGMSRYISGTVELNGQLVEWRTIPGFEGRYGITEAGTVINLKKMKPVRYVNVKGYNYIRIRTADQRLVLMRWETVVAEVWLLERPLASDEVAYSDGSGVHVIKYLEGLEKGVITPWTDGKRQTARLEAMRDSIIRDWRSGMSVEELRVKYRTEKLKVYDIIREYRERYGC